MTQGNLMYEVHNRRAVEEALVANSTLYKKIETAYKVCRSYNVEMRKENARLQSIVAIQTEVGGWYPLISQSLYILASPTTNIFVRARPQGAIRTTSSSTSQKADTCN
jgi:hypothetical protein